MEFGKGAGPWIVAYGVVAVGIIFSNLLMTVVFAKSRAVRRMRTTLFLIGMTAADLIVGVVAIPMYMAILWPKTQIARNIQFPWRLVEMSSSLVSIFLLAVIALERVYAVFWPYRHRSLGRASYRWAFMVPWLLMGLQILLQLLELYDFMSQEELFCYIFTFMVASSIVIVVSYVAIWRKMKTTRVEGLQQRRDLQERKLARTLAILTGVFLATWLPFCTLYAYFNITSRLAPYYFLYVSKVLHYSNSFMNPVIYSLRIPQVRSALAEIFCGRGGRVVAPAALQMGGVRTMEEEVHERIGGEEGNWLPHERRQNHQMMAVDT